MSENSREEEKLSFKEQILRDLERLKKEDRISEPTSDLFETLTNTYTSEQEKPESKTAEEELITNSVSAVDQLIANAPSVPPRSFATEEDSVESVEHNQPDVVEEEIHSTPTKVAVSYQTQLDSQLEDEEETFASNIDEETLVIPVQEDSSSEEADIPRRSRRESVKPTKKKKKFRFVRFLVTLLILLALLGVGGFYGYRYAESALQPVDPSSKQYVKVQIPEGANSQEIGSILEKSGLVKHGLLFTAYVKYKNYSDLKSGYYNLQKSMSTEDLIKALQKGGTPEPQEVVYANLTIPEGFTLEQIAQTVAQLQGEFKEPLTAEAFMAKVQDTGFIELLVQKYPKLLTQSYNSYNVKYVLEGFLFPATYDMNDNKTLQMLITEMVAKTDEVLSKYYSQIEASPYTLQQIMALASLIEKEGVKLEDRKKIASVFYNRLEKGMMLQTDVAVQYALGEHKEALSLKDLEVDSPYNLYQNYGVGPGPYNSPSEDSIVAALEPEKTDYLYFVADIHTKEIYYAKTYEEHLELKAKYVDKE